MYRQRFVERLKKNSACHPKDTVYGPMFFNRLGMYHPRCIRNSLSCDNLAGLSHSPAVSLQIVANNGGKFIAINYLENDDNHGG